VGANEWKEAQEWPLPETKWTPFYLHADGLLSEHEFWPNDGSTTYEDSPHRHDEIEFKTPPIVENTEICGPIVLNLFGSTTAKEILWFVSLWHFDGDGRATLLTRGWLRGSQRKLDDAASRPWQPVHSHTAREPLEPNKVYEFNIEIRPYGILLKPGERIGIKIKSADNDPVKNYLELVGIGHVSSAGASQVTVHHNSKYPSHLLLPITKGNRLGTFISGGKLPPVKRP
jgi:putative CocE/NonD family hydrolase